MAAAGGGWVWLCQSTGWCRIKPLTLPKTRVTRNFFETSIVVSEIGNRYVCVFMWG